MLRKSCVHSKEDYIVRAVLYCMFFHTEITIKGYIKYLSVNCSFLNILIKT